MTKNILLMYITNVSGHHLATLSIEKALKRIDQSIGVININGFNYVTPIVEKLVHKTYLGVVKRMPFIWDFLYDNPSIVKKSTKLKNKINKKNQSKISSLIENENCRVVVCSQAFPCGFVAEYKRLKPEKDVKLIAVLTDFVPHSYWVYDEVDYYIVPSQDAKQILINKGVTESKIKVFGIPIDPKFTVASGRDEASKELGVLLDEPVVLIMGGGHGIGPIEELIKSLNKSPRRMQLVVVTGINTKLYNRLKKIKFKKNVHIYGYVDHIDKLMTIADVIITKPGGITTSEALAKCVPMIIIKPLPGQEQNNTKFLLKMGVAEKADSIKQATEKLNNLLEDPSKINTMKEKISLFSSAGSSEEIAKLAISLC